MLKTASGIAFFVLVIGLQIFGGAYCFQYCLWNLFGKDVPWYADMIAGTVLAEIVGPCSIVVWIVKLCGVHTPIF